MLVDQNSIKDQGLFVTRLCYWSSWQTQLTTWPKTLIKFENKVLFSYETLQAYSDKVDQPFYNIKVETSVFFNEIYLFLLFWCLHSILYWNSKLIYFVLEDISYNYNE